jgi:hypothetical protein
MLFNGSNRKNKGGVRRAGSDPRPREVGEVHPPF